MLKSFFAKESDYSYNFVLPQVELNLQSIFNEAFILEMIVI